VAISYRNDDDMRELFSTFNPSNPTWDLFIILFFVVAAFLYGLTLGRARVVVQIVSSYMTMAVLSAAPFLTSVETKTPFNHTVFYLVAFLVIFVALFLLLSKSAFHQHLSEGRGGWLDVLILSIVQIGLVTTIVLGSMSENAVGHLSSITRRVFTGQPATFVWIILPIAALIFIKGKKDRK
jgi:predicted neutral ceramidase superfamily lipid hydrolase